MLLSIVIAILIFGLIIVVHELGHFAAARANNVAVLEFAIGMGPALFKKQKGETLYSIRAFPIGGYCKMLGEDESNNDPRALVNKKVWQRLIVSVSGALMNFALALLISLIIVLFAGFTPPVVGRVYPDSPAEAAGIMSGDVISRINGIKINNHEDLSFVVNVDGANPLNVQIKRDGQTIDKQLTARYIESSGVYIIGIEMNGRAGLLTPNAAEGSRAGLIDSICAGYYKTNSYVKSTLISIGKLFTLQVSIDKMSGPIGVTSSINDVVGDITASEQITASQKAVEILYFASIMAVLMSANVGVFNLLPLPALDGGRCVFLIIEAIRKKPIDPNKEGMVHFVGLALLLVLAAFVAFSDVFKII